MAVWTIMTLQQWFICIRLCQTHLTCLHAFSPDASHHGPLPQQHKSDLNPIPENRVRGAFPHPTYSMWLLLHDARHFLAHYGHDLWLQLQTVSQLQDPSRSVSTDPSTLNQRLFSAPSSDTSCTKLNGYATEIPSGFLVCTLS